MLRAGLTVAGADVLLRHSFGVTVLWRFGDTTAVGGPTRPARLERRATCTPAGGPRSTSPRPTPRRSSPLRLAGDRSCPTSSCASRNVAVGRRSCPSGACGTAGVAGRRSIVERETLTRGRARRQAQYRNAFRAAWTVNTAQDVRPVDQRGGRRGRRRSRPSRCARRSAPTGTPTRSRRSCAATGGPAHGHAVLAARAGYGAASGDRERPAPVLPGRHVVGRQPRELRERRVPDGPRLRRPGRRRQPHRRRRASSGGSRAGASSGAGARCRSSSGRVHGAVFATRATRGAGEFSTGRLKASVGVEGSHRHRRRLPPAAHADGGRRADPRRRTGRRGAGRLLPNRPVVLTASAPGARARRVPLQ